MQIVTGYIGEPHITAAQDRARNQGAFGTGNYILGVGSKMAATAASANEIRIADGALSMQGCVAVIASGTYDSVTIANGTQGQNRRDLIVARYTRNASTGVEDVSLAVIQGTPTSGTPSVPAYTSGDIQAGDTLVEMPLYRVNLSGVSVTVASVATTLSTLRETWELAQAVQNLYDIDHERVMSLLTRMTSAETNISGLTTRISTTETNLTALTTRVSTAEGKLSQLVLWKNYTRQYTVNANASLNITAAQFGFSVPTGYATLAPIVFSTGSPNVYPQGVYCNVTGSTAAMVVKNTSSSSVTATATLRIAYIRGSVFDAG